jgi:hypothetical protein
MILCSIAICLSACVKDTSGSQPMLVQSIAIDSNACVINFTYDAQSRLSAIVQCDTTETYTYSHDTVYDTKTSAGVLIYKNVYTINHSGLAGSYVAISAGGLSASYVLTYDAAGHLLSSIDTSHINTANTFQVQNNDIVQQQSTSTVTGNNYTVNTAFYPNTINRITNANFGLTFLGTSSANLKKCYTYILDDNNGIAQRTSTINGVVTEVRNYTYY